MRGSSNSIKAVDPTIFNLQRELRSLKLEEKKYTKLSKKMRELQRKSQAISGLEEQTQNTANKQVEEIQRLKDEIESCMMEIQSLEGEYAQLDGQIDQSNKEISSLQSALENIQIQNGGRRLEIKKRGDFYIERKNEIERSLKDKDEYEKTIDHLKQEVSLLTEQEYRLKKDAEVLEYQKAQEENVKTNLIQYISKLKNEKTSLDYSLRQLGSSLETENMKCQNLKEELNTLKIEESELMNQLFEKQEKFNQINEKSVRNKKRVEELEKELRIVDQDLRTLSDEYARQSECLAGEEERNRELNSNFDRVSRDAVETWESMKELLQLAENHSECEGYETLLQIRKQAWEAWNRLQDLIQ